VYSMMGWWDRLFDRSRGYGNGDWHYEKPMLN
jgi:hypothetical protein